MTDRGTRGSLRSKVAMLHIPLTNQKSPPPKKNNRSTFDVVHRRASVSLVVKCLVLRHDEPDSVVNDALSHLGRRHRVARLCLNNSFKHVVKLGVPVSAARACVFVCECECVYVC